MKVGLAADFSAIRLKDLVKAYLLEQGHEITDLGQMEGEADLVYPEAAKRLALKIQAGAVEKGFLFCGTGGGVSIMANKFQGVYCVASEGIFTAYKMSQLNGANVLAMGKKVVGEMEACEMAERFLNTEFCQDFTPERKEFVSGLRQRMLEIEAENFMGNIK